MNETSIKAPFRIGWHVELAFVLALVVVSTWLKLLSLGDRAFVYDESIYVPIAKYFVTKGYDFDVQRALGTAHMPLQPFIMGWGWLLAGKFASGLSEEFVFRLPSVIFSALAIPVVYGIGRQFSLRVASVAALFFSFHPYLFVYSRFAALDFPSLFWVVLGFFFYLKWALKEEAERSKSGWELWSAGIALGLGGLTKNYSLLVITPIMLHSLLEGWVHKKIWTHTWDGARVALATCLTVVLGSWVLAERPLLLYSLTRETVLTRYSIPSTLINRPTFQIAYVLQDLARGARSELQTLWTHLGPGAFLVCLVGAFRVLDESGKVRRVGVAIIVFFVLVIAAFASFHWPRYLLVVGGALSILFAFGVVAVVEHLPSIFKWKRSSWAQAALGGGLLAIGLASFQPFLQLPSIYSSQVVDDWVYGDGYKAAAGYIKTTSHNGDWALTNGHNPILTYYSGLPTHLYMGFGPELRVYEIYNDAVKEPAMEKVSVADERRLRYILLDYTPNIERQAIFKAQLLYAIVNPALVEYVDSYFRPVMGFDKGVVRLYERSSRNIYSALQEPQVWVGEGGAVWKQNLVNYNGWILGDGWGQPKAVSAGGETFWTRSALRDNRRFSDFMLPIAGHQQQFTFFADGASIQVIKVALKQ